MSMWEITLTYKAKLQQILNEKKSNGQAVEH